MAIGEIIKTRRESLKWTQFWLALKAGVSESQIRRIETGSTENPGYKTIHGILDVLGIDDQGEVND